jgi:GAF domain-containing protein
MPCKSATLVSGTSYRWDDEALRLIATHNTPPAFAEARRLSPPYRPDPKPGLGRMIPTMTLVQVADLAAEEGYIERRDPGIVEAVELGGVRTALIVPMLKENELIGALVVQRQEVRSFTDKQIELVQKLRQPSRHRHRERAAAQRTPRGTGAANSNF